mmetsp:Transcript_13507/g.20077  ORF Transcript_13507/g.20077 Transcript_13507/m.20077 type:complete len:166 (-) Transcript_13507:333-830(-)
MIAPDANKTSNSNRRIALATMLLVMIGALTTTVVLFLTTDILIRGKKETDDEGAQAQETKSSPPKQDANTFDNPSPPDTIPDFDGYEDPFPQFDDIKDTLSGPWPECVGMEGNECANLILKDSPDLAGNIFLIPPNTPVTEDYRLSRVRIMVDNNNIVVEIPLRG